MAQAVCSRGWSTRCPMAIGKPSRCVCRCGGANHGTITQLQIFDDKALEQSVQ